ncbi:MULTISPECIES: LysR family transcriptional regulator [unclassified Paracoccus (in: a-proteobacteria)]|uniref:LysR family transcriptional regulator n=1 Tax=unclassified Paracoccus (in: a-proteobacteria) TaxID=2688777 RepID=UPI001602251E|nr:MULTISPECIES: LysR family transcriptional regulator [unclassified Paracoccus (in: a-proteobacteria)]MBB1492859.1 LysR family transcriptional regulator [Paracoccus sp. MC1854]MBB1499508.1 LysR family transcriptional regulator [Paracoccus sp. MC1862]QQO45819.1 LysR family transcriptional regulator [Paracoccus sp. MC1862]
MDLRQLRSFLEICRAGSITQAADRLNMAQPALTRQIQSLEEEMGVLLLHRHGRGVSLTAQGELLQARSRQLLEDADDLVRVVSGRDGELRGMVRLGLPPALAEVLTAPLIERFMTEHPHAQLRVSSGFTGHVRDWLRRGEVDLGVTYELALARGQRAIPLLREELCLICPPGEPLAGEPITFAEAFSGPLILPTPIHALRQLIDKAADIRGIVPVVVAEIDVVSAMLTLVEKNLGRTILSRAMGGQAAQVGSRLVIRPIVDPVLSRMLALWQSPARDSTPVVRRFAQELLEQARLMVQQGAWPGALPVRPDIEHEGETQERN